MNCRHCLSTLKHTFLDLGCAPPSNAYLTRVDLQAPEKYYPLRIMVCDRCWLVQTEDYAGADELFDSNYAYFSSISSSWLDHARRFVGYISKELQLGKNSHVIEVASNDGYLLRNFVAAGVPCLGIEPTASTADAAEKFGIPVVREFFGEGLGRRLANEGKQADLIVGNNVYAHVPDINDFTRGLKAALKPTGTITLEFPHLMRLIQGLQFDTVYHEHFSYLSVHAVSKIFEASGLRVLRIEELPTHGGSLRIYGCHIDDVRKTEPSVSTLLEREINLGLRSISRYRAFQVEADRVKDDFVKFLIEQKREGKTVAAYGAAAKGSTLLNYGGIKADLLPFVCDAAPSKQGKYLPGSRIPIYSPEVLIERPPDYLVIFPWNIAEEVIERNSSLIEHGTRFVTAVPKLTII